jgi:shikimate dehydrogenase
VHGVWIERHQLDAAYLPMAVPPEQFAVALRALPSLGFAGANVTVPHKEAALAAVHDASAEARALGAVNTVVVQKNGTLLGSNTDGQGFLANVRDFVPGWSARGKRVTLLGAGGAAKAIAWALHGDGAAEVRVVNRTLESAKALVQSLGLVARALPWESTRAALDGVDLLVNCTTLGMKGQPPLEVDLAPLPGDALVADIVYTPLETELLRRARRRGNRVVDGIGMLLHQAKPGFTAWFGREPVVDQALREFVLKGL